METNPLELTRAQILAYRRRVGGLDTRVPMSARSLRRAAWAGLQDSMPRAAVLSLHARVKEVGPTTWEDPSLLQLWGPRFSTYVVAAPDLGVFSLGRFPDAPAARHRAVDLAARLGAFLGEDSIPYRDAGRALGVNPNMLRYAAATGTVVIRWDGARPPSIRTVPPPSVDPHDARSELARRYLHVFGPATSAGFARWAGIKPRAAAGAFEALTMEVTPVRTPIGDAWLLSRDEAAMRDTPGVPAPARFLPSGDAYYLLQGDDRSLLVPEPDRAARLWTPRVWPGAVLVAGEIVGTWRRSGNVVTIETWTRLHRSARDAVEAEAASLPIPDIGIVVQWID